MSIQYMAPGFEPMTFQHESSPITTLAVTLPRSALKSIKCFYLNQTPVFVRDDGIGVPIYLFQVIYDLAASIASHRFQILF